MQGPVHSRHQKGAGRKCAETVVSGTAEGTLVQSSARPETPGSALLTVLNLRKSFDRNGNRSALALDNISFEVRRGEFLSIVGPSGCGKTTLLMCLVGLIPPTGGRVLLEGRSVDRPPKQMGIVFQNYTNSLFPWRSVLGNVLLALDHEKIPQSRKIEVAERFLEHVGLAGFGKHYPWELSGGMQQRVAIARGLAYGSDIILMDEPFASVDAQTRAELEDFLLRVWKEYAKTILFVTHDIDEAIYLSDRVMVLSARPSVVLDDVAVDLERPRDQLDTRGDARFIALRKRIYQTLRS